MALNLNINQPIEKDPRGIDPIKDKDRPFTKINYYMMAG